MVRSTVGLRKRCWRSFVVYYESLKRETKTKTTYGYRCDERLKINVKESTRLGYTPLCAELEHLKIETRLTRETPVSEMGEYPSVIVCVFYCHLKTYCGSSSETIQSPE